MPSKIEYIITFLISGTTVTGISYLGNSVNPLLGGILSGIPISIPSMLLIRHVSKQKDFILAASIMVGLLGIVTFLCYFMYVKLDISNYLSVFISSFVWCLGGILYYYCFLLK